MAKNFASESDADRETPAKPEREFAFTDPETKDVIPYVVTAFGKSWKLLQDPALPECVAPGRVYRVDGYCPHSYDGHNGQRGPVADPRAKRDRPAAQPDVCLPLPAFAEQEHEEESASKWAGGQPGLLVKGIPGSMSEATLVDTLRCMYERPTVTVLNGGSAVISFQSACAALYACQQAQQSGALGEARRLCRVDLVSTLEASATGGASLKPVAVTATNGDTRARGPAALPSVDKPTSASGAADDDFISAPLTRNMGFPSKMGLSFKLGEGKGSLGHLAKLDKHVDLSIKDSGGAGGGGGRQVSPPRPEQRSNAGPDSPPRPESRQESAPTLSHTRAGTGHLARQVSPPRPEARSSSAHGSNGVNVESGRADGEAEGEAEALLKSQCAELERLGVGSIGIKVVIDWLS